MLRDTRNVDVKEFLQGLVVQKKMSNAYPMEEGRFGEVWDEEVEDWETMQRNFVSASHHMSESACSPHQQIITMNRQQLCPDFEFYLTAGQQNLRRNYFQNPTIALRKKETMKRNTGNLPFENIHCPVDMFEWKSSELVIDFSTGEADDLYPTNNNEDKERAAVLAGQLTAYWREHSEKQHRTHLYQVIIFGPNVRLLRFARDGITSSVVFNYIENPDLLVEFFWRYSIADDKHRGWDTSVLLASGAQANLFERKVRGWIDTVKGRKNLPNYEKTFDCCPTATYKMVARIKRKDHTLLVRRPFFCASSPFERHTRGYLAFDIEGNEVIFMKDAWRTSGDGARISESDICKILKTKKIPYTPDVLFADDVVDNCRRKQETTPQLCRKTGWKTWYTHYRLCQRLAIPLAAAMNSKEFVLALHHAGLSKCTSSLAIISSLLSGSQAWWQRMTALESFTATLA